MWNNVEIRPPPINSYRTSSKSVDTAILRKSLEELVKKTNGCKQKLHVDAAVLSRVLYKLKIQFRSDPGMKNAQKVNKTLHKYLNFDLENDIKYLSKSVPVYSKKIEQEIWAPTKQMLQFVMLRIQGFSKVISRIIDTAADTAFLMVNRMKLGHCWNVALIMLAIMSRIWQICTYIVYACCACFQQLLPIHEQLQIEGVPFLEEGYTFPAHLQNWLGLKWTLQDLKKVTSQHLEIPTFVLSDDEGEDDIQFMYQYKNNEKIVIDDDLEIADDDIQFINEYINLIGLDDRKHQVQNHVDINNSSDESVVVIDSENNTESRDIEILDLPSQRNLFESDDIGEVIDRNIINNNNNRENNKNVNNSNRESLEIIELSPQKNIFESADTGERINKKKLKRRKRSKKEKIIQSQVLQTVDKRKLSEIDLTESTPKRRRLSEDIITLEDTMLSINDSTLLSSSNISKDNEDVTIIPETRKSKKKFNKTNNRVSIITIPDSPISISSSQVSVDTEQDTVIGTEVDVTPSSTITTPGTKKQKKKKKKKNLEESSSQQVDSLLFNQSIQEKSQSSNINSESFTTEHSIDTIRSIKDFNTFLAREKRYRTQKHPNRLSANLSVSKWFQLLKHVEKIFATRKMMKQDKMTAVNLAKDVLRFYMFNKVNTK